VEKSLNLQNTLKSQMMSLFQSVVIKKQIASHTEKIQQAYKNYAAYFLNPDIQENIRNSKEEQFQEGFLRELFVKILGYTLNPDPDYNLITEKKNETNSKKADGAILVNGEVRGVIELKDHKTTDLKQVEAQAFGYKNYNAHASYVIISNFEKLRFYIDTAVEFEEFNLFTLTENDFAVLWICLAYENIAIDLPKQLKAESVSNEEQITKQLYKDYSTFKRELYANLTFNNPDIDKLTLFKKTQKLLDRLLFIFFAEDGNLLPPNSMSEIIIQWEKLKELDAYIPLYDRIKKYFGYMNTGFKGKKYDVFAYNGGLFKPDEVLDHVIIFDEVLHRHLQKLSQYDFASEVDVNILGHIFENSLSEIEEITNEITTGQKATSKRKKDGVFYTPRYITKYIVENTLGKLCADKKAEMGITNLTGFENLLGLRSKKEKKQFADQLDNYREWLLALTICDPACGSGAFLNAALDFLMNEHRLIDEMTAKLFGNAIVFPNIENAILENNLYGVDINEESVEIARLSLWLRTAKPQRKLNSLNNNIKCGNSLISPQPPMTETNPKDSHVYSNDATYTTFDPEGVAQTLPSNDSINIRPAGSNNAFDKAFDWHKEFPQVFEKGGFDVVIGNPPYGIFIEKNLQAYYSNHFPLTKYKTNLFILFIERMLQVFDSGIVHFIIPKSLLFNSYYESIRKELILKTELNEIFTITEKVFEDAEVGSSLLLKFTIKKNPNQKNIVRLAVAEKIQNFVSNTGLIENNISQDHFLTIPNCEISIVSDSSQSILTKLSNFNQIRNFYTLKNGLNPGNIKHILISENKISDKHKPIIWGREISRYNIEWQGQYINYDDTIGSRISIEDVKSKEGMNKQNKIDFALRTSDLFETKKIVVRKTGDSIICSLDINHYYFDTLVHGIYEKEVGYTLEALLAILNSTPATIFYRLLHDIKGKVFAKISLDNLSAFPIPANMTSYSEQLSENAKKRLLLTSDLQTKRQRFLKRLSDNFSGIKITSVLEHFDELEFVSFLAELKKQKISLSLKQQDEWEEYFNEYKTECRNFVGQIEATDKEIDGLVYALYGLTEEEIRIIENK
jgi:hypothetical protein